jgi:Family of unknown function (DUF5755)
MPKYVKNIPVLYSGSKKCPPGVICLENMTMFFIVLMIALLIYYFFRQSPKTNEKIIIQEKIQKPAFINALVPNYPYTNQPDVLLDPYAPPLRDERYLVPIPDRIPINVQTNIGAVDTNYRQLGLLKPVNGTKNILPLMGRPLLVNRDTWQYYTMSDQNNSIKLPIIKKGKSCTNEYGCDSLYTGDVVLVEGYDQRFRVTLYDSDTVRYIPY